MPERFSASSNPMFDMVVATTVAFASAPRACMSRAASSRTASPLTTRPCGIAKKRTVGIAVERNADIKLPVQFRHKARHRFRMQRAAILVDVLSVGRGVQESRIDLERAKQLPELPPPPRRWRNRPPREGASNRWKRPPPASAHKPAAALLRRAGSKVAVV